MLKIIRKTMKYVALLQKWLIFVYLALIYHKDIARTVHIAQRQHFLPFR